MNRVGISNSIGKIIFSIFLFLFFGSSLRSFGQTDKDFWFVVPEITWAHNFPGGVPANFRLSTMAFPATVTISMPANQFHPTLNPGGFKDIVVNMLPNTTQSVDMAPFVRKVPAVAGEPGEANVIENKAYNASGINNIGLHITSTNVITAYYEVGNLNNSDIWALKGKNALGTEFYTPFQNQTPNVAHNPPAYSAIDIVATEDGTVVSITPPIDAAYGLLNTVITAGSTYSVILNRGQTFSVFPKAKGITAAAHIGGTKVTSSKPIAITLKDDSINHTTGGCYDVVGDQLVPTSIIGWDYIAIRSQLTTKDHIYITATVDGTNVTVRYGATVLNYTLNAGQQQYVPFPDPQATMRITSDITHPIYVFHIGGFGCEQGGAILPPINICTGSTQVAFTRANSQSFFINLMVRDGAEGKFELDGSAAAATALFNPLAFLTVPGPVTKWKAARFGPFTLAQITQTQHLLRNTEDLFHLGIVNGGGGTGCMYGYFSDYNELKIAAVVAGTAANVLKTCYGVPVQLFATGGTNFKWTPGIKLSNDTIFNPFANPELTTQYKVIVEGACEMRDSAFITVAVSTKLEANFSADKVVGCAPLTVNFKDNSIGVAYWRWDFGDGSAYEIYDTDASITFPDPKIGGVYPHTFQNNTALPITYHVELLVKNADACAAIYTKDILVYPSMNAAFTDDYALPHCSPKTVNFTNTSTTNTADTYLWEYGDGVTENMANTNPVSHKYTNLASINTPYTMQLIATSPFGCKDTASKVITVSAYIKADFDIDKAAGCSPLTVGFTNKATGQINTWTLSNFGAGPQPASPTAPGNYSLTYNNLNPVSTADIVNNLTLTVTNSDGCISSMTKQVTTYAEVHAGIPLPLPPDTAFCTPHAVQFGSSTTTNPVTYSWAFGDGGTYSLDNPLHTYTNLTYSSINPNVSLVLTTPRGCKDSVARALTIYSLIKADFSVDTPRYCSPFKILIDNNSRSGLLTNYSWNYDDGTALSNTTGDHSHTYLNAPPSVAPITPNLTLTLTNEGGCTSILTRPITVYPEVHASFVRDQLAGCTPLLVGFTYNGNSTATIFNWDFGDFGSSVTKDPIHEYVNTTGVDVTYTAKLFALSDFGCKDDVDLPVTVYAKVDPNFAIDKVFGCSPLSFNVDNKLWSGNSFYNWDWQGDGTTDSTTNSVTSVFRHFYENKTGAVQNIPLTLTVGNTHPVCNEKMVRMVQVYPEVDAIFTPLSQTGCNPFDLTFSNASVLTGSVTKPDSYFWTFGDGSSARDENPLLHRFVNSSTVSDVVYPMKLVVETVFGCRDSLETNITVHPLVEADFALNTRGGCSPLTLNLENLTVSSSYGYSWKVNGNPPFSNVGSPGTITLTNPTIAPPSLQPDILTLQTYYTGDPTCNATVTKVVNVYPRVYPGFNLNSTGCQPLTVNFANTTNSYNGTATYKWDFGNLVSTLDPNPSTIYFNNSFTLNKDYEATLTATSEHGCVDSIKKLITVYPKPFAGFKFVSPSVACAPFNFELQNISKGTGLTYTYDFGDGTPDLITPNAGNIIHPYQNVSSDIAGYLLKLNTETAYGCKDSTSQMVYTYPMVRAAFNPIAPGCNPLTVTLANTSLNAYYYTWNFDDGQLTGIENPTHRFVNNTESDRVFAVKLSAESQYNCAHDTTVNVTVYAAPIAAFEIVPPLKIFPDATFGFTNLTKPAAASWTYKWSMGDGQVRNVKDLGTYTYTKWGLKADGFRYEVILESDNGRCKDSVHRFVYLLPAQPIALYTSDASSACAPFLVHFYNNSSYFDRVEWDFGDGNTSTESEPIHTYTTAGYYNSKLTVFGDGGLAYKYNTLRAFQNPIADFKINPEELLLPEADAHFFNTSKFSSRYQWDFDDAGSSSNDKDPVHRYSKLGAYDVKLTVWTDPNEGNCVDDTTITAAVRVIGQGKLAYPNAFTPNITGPTGGAYSDVDFQNQVFHPVWEGVSVYILRIYNRWGEQVFESKDVKIGWDGYYKEKLCDPDVYVWKAVGRFTNGQSFEKIGDVTLIR